MDSLLFLLSLIGVMVVIGWAVVNDKVPDGGKTKGLLAMHHPDDETAKPKRRSRR
ncbi:hypothetical protein N825_27265 [Skermanella stibiiresistens SB22]|jgi:hypothetical protein|uniref:Uncharacterized protein n=1 Tax=Skermanella stibiiresistens SB22 TaxID=1385369 RepID=W9HC67_9PROT|nr:hypothetical protein [Skermanella stibiiresistens]EWY41478.1 hypothetical protein N825_27265 [Skermanella stibiiresistens SB22]